MKQLTEEQAIAFYDSGAWKCWSKKEVARFQLFQDCLCVPWDVFHEGTTELLGRPIFTHEFADAERLKKEYLTQAPPPTLEEIVALIPEEKRIVIFAETRDELTGEDSG